MKPTLAHALIALAALMLAIATALGALASHALDGVLEPASLRSFETGVQYQFVHSLGLLAVSVYAERCPRMKSLMVAGVLLFAGIVLFCGGVYTSSLNGPSWIVGLAPVGGVGLILAWLTIAGTAAWQFATRKS